MSPIEMKDLEKRMRQLGVNESDIEESFVRSSGPGGQNVNKVATCVCMRHRLSGITVKCQEFRSQGLNRFWARKYLLDRIETKQNLKIKQQIQNREKIRRQNRKRSKALKEKILHAKRFRSEKKSNRRSIRTSHIDE